MCIWLLLYFDLVVGTSDIRSIAVMTSFDTKHSSPASVDKLFQLGERYSAGYETRSIVG